MATTIQISDEMKEKLNSFGVRGESYNEILERIFSLAVQVQLKQFLLETSDSMTISEAREELEKKWPRS